jgi:hypothetical protein
LNSSRPEKTICELVPFFKPRAGENKQRFSGACEWFG